MFCNHHHLFLFADAPAPTWKSSVSASLTSSGRPDKQYIGIKSITQENLNGPAEVNLITMINVLVFQAAKRHFLVP